MHDEGDTHRDPPGGGAENSSGVIREPISPELLGSASVTPSGDFEAGSWASFALVYTAGAYGIDDSGSLRVCFRFASDQSAPQFEDPTAPNYTTIEASNGAVLQYRFDTKGNVRPWDKTLLIKVVNGYLLPGATITVRFGVTDHGSPGMRVQTFCEERFEFRVLVDPVATFNFQPIPEQPIIRIVPGKPQRFVATLPSRKRLGEPFALHIKGEDRWGNPSDRCEQLLILKSNQHIENLPEAVQLKPGEKFARIEGLSVQSPGPVEISILGASGNAACTTNPLEIVSRTELLPYWADLHGQSEETIGTGSARDYYAFARDLGPVDAISHQGNDFQITNEFWQHLDTLTTEFEAPGAFLAVPGYEWSGNTGLGGDRNVFFPTTGRQIRRSSHALIEDRTDIDTDCHTARDLFDAFAANEEWDVICYAHCGGRYADIHAAHDARFEKSVEVHSSWGTFEWLVHDAFDLGYRVGIVANSDGHKGRPGASYPGASMFGAIGGLTCFLLPALSRDALFDGLRKRRHYATTGGPAGRPIIDISASFSEEATVFNDDPAIIKNAGNVSRHAMMGDIVHIPSGDCEISVAIRASSPIERLDIFNGRELIETIRPYQTGHSEKRIRLVWEGAEYRGRFRQVIWDGHAEVAGNTIVGTRAINFFNPDRPLTHDSSTKVSWKALTTGNVGGIDLWLGDAVAGTLKIQTPLVKKTVEIASIGPEGKLFDRAGDLPRYLKAYRLPEKLSEKALQITRRIRLRDEGDNPIFIRLTQEDGTLAWTSPIYIYR